jgi:hypothetical protein
VAGLVRYRFDGRDDSAGPLLLRHEILHHFAVHAALLGRAVAVILSGQHAAGQGRPCREAEVQGLCHRDQFPLDGSLDQAVFDLQASKGRPSAQLGKCIRLGDPPLGASILSDDFFNNSIIEKIIASEQNRQVDLLSEEELSTIHKSVLQDKFSELAQELVTLQQHKKPSMKNKYRSILSANQLERLNTDLSLTFNLVNDFNAASIRDQDARIISMAIAKLVVVDASQGLNLDIVFKHSGESIILGPDENYYVFRIGKYPQIVQDGSNRVVWVDDDPISWSIVYNHAENEGSRVSVSEQIDDDKLLIRLLGNYTEKTAPLFQEHRPGLLADITLSIDPLRDPKQARKNFKIKELEFFTFFEKR